MFGIEKYFYLELLVYSLNR